MIYYVIPLKDDEVRPVQDGLTPDTAWATIAQATSQMPTEGAVIGASTADGGFILRQQSSGDSYA